MNGRNLQIDIHPPESSPAHATPLSPVGGMQGYIETSDEPVKLQVILADVSRSELRWMLDRMVRRLASSLQLGGFDIHMDQRIDDDTCTALALDLAVRSGGEFRISDEPIAARVADIRRHEELFKTWVNEDPSTRTSIAIANDVIALADDHASVEAEVLEEDRLRSEGLNLLLAVGGGGEASPARLVIAHYRPNNEDERPLMLLGKGVTFDTGGINVKPYESYVSMMRNDMAGAALAFSLFRALVEADYPHAVSLVLPTCENAIGSRAMRPGAVVKSYRGIDVRIDHTDAEGRLILADGLSYASDQIDPRHVLSFATLTTAALIAYGPFATPVHFAPPSLESRLTAAGIASGEDLHFFPERIWHLDANTDKEADVKNTARLPGDAARAAGSRNAAHFLKHFTDHPITHFDIFASTWNWSGEAPGAGFGATGAPLRTLLTLFADAEVIG